MQYNLLRRYICFLAFTCLVCAEICHAQIVEASRQNAYIGELGHDHHYTEFGIKITTWPSGMTLGGGSLGGGSCALLIHNGVIKLNLNGEKCRLRTAERRAQANTIGADGKIIYQKDGLRLRGRILLSQFKAALRALVAYTPSKFESKIKEVKATDGVIEYSFSPINWDQPLISRKVKYLEVVTPDYLKIMTLAPKKEGSCPHGDDVELRKVDGKWRVQVTGMWVA